MQGNIQVSLKEFLEVLKKARVGKKIGQRNIKNEMVRFKCDSDNLLINVMSAEYKIKKSGSWQGCIAVSLELFNRLRLAPPKTDPLPINSCNKTLKIGSTSFKARLHLIE